jgi:hypothetical protein
MTDQGWRSALRCRNTGCMEVRNHRGWLAVRNSGSPSVVVYVTPEEWRAFKQGVRDGDFETLDDE